MSHRLWVITIVLVTAVAAIIALSFLAFAGNIIALSITVLILAALAVLTFDYLVFRPALLEYAKRRARNYCEAGQIVDPKLHQRLCERLSTAPGDAEAATLHQKLNELKGKEDKSGTRDK